MKDIQFLDDPSPHIIIDEFLSPKLAKACLEEAINLEKNYHAASVMGDGESLKHMENCEDCKKNYDYNRMAIRENDIVYLDTYYQNNRNDSIILKALHEAITKPEFMELVNKQGYWHILRSTRTSESILSRYGMCDFYGFHRDIIPNNPASRIVTLCYYFNKEPEQFEGGDLIICGNTIHDQKKIKPKHNRAIIFQSDSTTHAVDSVKLNTGKFEDGRFSINFWLGFTGGFNYR